MSLQAPTLRLRPRARPISALGLGLGWYLLTVSQIVADALALGAAFLIAYQVRFRSDLPIFQSGEGSPDLYVHTVAWALPIWLVCFAVYGLYDRRHLYTGLQEYTRVFNGCTAGVLGVVLIGFLLDTPNVARAWLLLVWLLTFSLVCIERVAFRRLVHRLRASGLLATITIIVGANDEGRALAEQFVSDRASGAWVSGYVDNQATTASGFIGELPLLGRLDDIGDIVSGWGVVDLVIASTALSREDLLDLYQRYGHDQRIELRLSSGLFEILTTGARVHHVSSVPLMTLERFRINGLDAVLKTTLDYAVAGLAVLALLPLLLVLAVAVWIDSPGPILFRRRVLGRGGKQFDAFKLRTMIPDRRVRQVAIEFPDRRQRDKDIADPRVTRFGRLLRRTSLDELPQLFNVIRGEMSLVGPRMISPEEARKFGKWELNLLTVKPGITGPWQVAGRAEIAYEDRVRLNMDYIRNYTIWRDLEILLRTIPAVLSGRGAF